MGKAHMTYADLGLVPIYIPRLIYEVAELETARF